MKMLFVVLLVLLVGYNLLNAQQKIFEKTNANTFTKSIKEKIERFKSRKFIKQWEEVQLKQNTLISTNYKGIFNIFDKNIEFEVTKDFGKGLNGVQGYQAELKDGGYAIISSSDKEIGASVWYKESFYNIESIQDGIYLVSETDMDEIAKKENPKDYGVFKKLNKYQQNNSVSSTISPATIKVLVAYTPAVDQNYNIPSLIPNCEITTNYTYSNSLVSSKIEIVHYEELNYTESGNDETDLSRFMTKNDGYMDDVHSLRNQYEADLCVLLVNNLNNNGLAGSIGATFSDAFCVVRAGSAVGYYSFAHELGHFLGCRHEEDDSSTEPFGNAHGFYWSGKMPYSSNPNRPYKTIMAVIDSIKYYRVPYFSNPNVYDQLNNPMGSTNYYYSANAINEYASTIAAFEPYYTTSGTITTNEWWRGAVNIVGPVTVNNGVTLTIEPGAVINVTPGASLVVNGTLNAIGNSGSNITFTRSGSSGSWGGIKFNSGSSGNITNAIITFAERGIDINQSNAVTISNTEIANCSGHGIYVYNTNYSTQPTITNCRIHNNTSSTGIVLYYSSPVITNTELYNNYNGTGIADYSSPYFGYTGTGNNNLHNNTNIGAYVKRYSSPVFGRVTPMLATNNKIMFNTFRDMQAEDYCFVYAENNWWGSASPDPSKIAAISGSTIDYEPYLFSEPNFFIGKNDLVYEHGDASIKEINPTQDILESNSEYDKSETLKEDPESLDAVFNLINLWKVTGKNELESFKSYLKNLSEKKETKLLYATAKLILAGYEKENKIKMIDEVIKDYNKHPVVETALMKKFLYYFNELNDYKSAEKVMIEMKEKFPSSSILEETKDHFESISSRYKLSGDLSLLNFEDKKAVSIKQDDYFIDAYPNPFNPTTTINYQIPTSNHVTIKVYDVLGREVKVLVNENKTAGNYTVTFNASGLSSGVYIYTISAANYFESKKMILTK